MFSIKFFGPDGTESIVQNLLFLELQMSFFSPAHRLRARFSAEGNVFDGTYTRLEGYWNGQKVYEGFVDEITYERSAKGRFILFESRSLIAVLLDNEAMPGSLADLSLLQLYNVHAGRFGCFKGIRADEEDKNTTLAYFTIPKGASEWYVLERYCEMALGSLPRLDTDGYINVQKSYSGDTYTISNALQNAIRYTSLRIENHEDEVITQVRILDKNLQYTVALNHDLPDHYPPRVRYLRESADWQGESGVDAQSLIKTGMLKRRQIHCVLPYIYPMKIGDRVNLNDSMFFGMNLFVGGVKIKIDASGLSTELTLLQPDYL